MARKRLDLARSWGYYVLVLYFLRAVEVTKEVIQNEAAVRADATGGRQLVEVGGIDPAVIEVVTEAVENTLAAVVVETYAAMLALERDHSIWRSTVAS